MSRPASAAESLCLACGLCCDGTLFADVKLQPADEPERLRQHGLRLLHERAGKDLLPDDPHLRFSQPCAALAVSVPGSTAARPWISTICGTRSSSGGALPCPSTSRP